ncbi:MAG TPA: hypothetical protein VK867_07030 [Candidatus Limnocylindrales bacterium]|nr:hypothetical protein [Candidatus Limnocylindrales bacterium]
MTSKATSSGTVDFGVIALQANTALSTSREASTPSRRADHGEARDGNLTNDEFERIDRRAQKVLKKKTEA